MSPQRRMHSAMFALDSVDSASKAAASFSRCAVAEAMASWFAVLSAAMLHSAHASSRSKELTTTTTRGGDIGGGDRLRADAGTPACDGAGLAVSNVRRRGQWPFMVVLNAEHVVVVMVSTYDLQAGRLFVLADVKGVAVILFDEDVFANDGL